MVARQVEIDPYDIIKHPYVTEKTMFQMERENKLEFIVRRTATKDDIRRAIEKLFEAKVSFINTKITRRGKKAIVKFHPDYKAEEIGMRIGVF
jgi:large subunit ribosomal protein L23